MLYLFLLTGSIKKLNALAFFYWLNAVSCIMPFFLTKMLCHHWRTWRVTVSIPPSFTNFLATVSCAKPEQVVGRLEALQARGRSGSRTGSVQKWSNKIWSNYFLSIRRCKTSKLGQTEVQLRRQNGRQFLSDFELLQSKLLRHFGQSQLWSKVISKIVWNISNVQPWLSIVRMLPE